MAMRIGCDHLVYAIMTAEDTVLSAPVYGDVKHAPGVMSININPNASLATAFFDDGPGDTASTLGNIEVEIQKNTLTTENKADLLGHSIDANGGLAYADDDTPPYVAIGFRTLKSNGKYRYVWLYKGRFADPEDNNETKADSINFQSDTITGQFVKLAKPITINGKEKKLWKYEIDADNPSANQGVMDNWFEEVVMPSNSATPAPTLSVTWAPGEVTGSTSATLSGAVGSGNHLAMKISSTSIATPSVGSYASGASVYTSGDDITGVDTDKYVAIYELTATNTVVKFVTKKLEAGDINAG